MARKFEQAIATAANVPTDALRVIAGEKASVSVSGGSAAVSMQRRLDGANWRTVTTYASGIEETYEADEGCEIRLYIATGAFTSGPVTMRVGKG